MRGVGVGGKKRGGGKDKGIERGRGGGVRTRLVICWLSVALRPQKL